MPHIPRSGGQRRLSDSGFPAPPLNKSEIVISHIRRANRGRVALENTHPFMREMWGQNWVFAHNGQLRGIKKLSLGAYRPIGGTDSEFAFCWMLGKLRERWSNAPSDRALHRAIEELSLQIGQHGVFNMLLSNGRSLYCFRSTNLRG